MSIFEASFEPGPLGTNMKRMDRTEGSSTRKSGWGIFFLPNLQFSSEKLNFERISLPDHQITKFWFYFPSKKKTLKSQYMKIKFTGKNPSFLEPKHPKIHDLGSDFSAPQPTLNTSVVSEQQNLSWFIRFRLWFFGPLSPVDPLFSCTKKRGARRFSAFKKLTHISKNIPDPKKTHTKAPKPKKRKKNKLQYHLVTCWFSSPKALVWDLCGKGDWRYHSSE